MEATLMQALAGMNIYTLLAILLWTMPWKAWALWLAARRGDLWWFFTLLILNSFGILEMWYIFLVAKQSDTPDTEKHSG